MADEPVRSLLAQLGFDFDPTGADRFKSKFNDLKITMKNAKGDFEDVNLDSFFKSMNDSFKKNEGATRKLWKLSLFRLGADVARWAMKATGKAFKVFATIDEAKSALEFRKEIGTSGLKKIEDAISKLPQPIKDLTTDLDLLNSVFDSMTKTSDLGYVLSQLERMAALGLATRQSTQGASSAFMDFIKTGAMGGLTDLGLTTAQEADEYARTKFSSMMAEVTPAQRMMFAQTLMPRLDSRLAKSTERISNSASGLFKRASSESENLSSSFGENIVAPVLKNYIFPLVDAIKDQTNRWEKQYGGGGIVNQTNTININGAQDPVVIGKAVNDVLSKKSKDIVDKNTERVAPQSANQIIPLGN